MPQPHNGWAGLGCWNPSPGTPDWLIVSALIYTLEPLSALSLPHRCSDTYCRISCPFSHPSCVVWCTFGKRFNPGLTNGLELTRLQTAVERYSCSCRRMHSIVGPAGVHLVCACKSAWAVVVAVLVWWQLWGRGRSGNDWQLIKMFMDIYL